MVARCLPERLRAMDADGLAVVAGLLRERLAAGWRPADIRAVMDQDLPQRVGRLSALVAARLERNVDPSLAPTSSSGGADAAARARADEDARWEARRRRSEELAGTVGGRRPGEEDLMVRAMARVRSESPGAGRAEQARLAAELVRDWQRQEAS